MYTMKETNSALVVLDLTRSTPKKPRFIVEIHNSDGDLVAENNFLGWGGLRLRNFFLFNDVDHVRYLGKDTQKAVGIL